MARPRVYGPYRHRQCWRIVIQGPEGKRDAVAYPCEAEAAAAARQMRLELAETELTTGAALVGYRSHLARKGNKPRSAETTLIRLGRWFGDREHEPLTWLSAAVVEAAYRRRVEATAGDTHRNELAEVKTFFRWCVAQKWLKRSPAEAIEPQGRRRRGKPQLRLGEAQRLSTTALEAARKGDTGAVAVLCALWLGLRSEEIRKLTVRDVDEAMQAVWLWVDATKTEAGRRRIEVPPELADLLLARAAGRLPGAWLFEAGSAEGYRTPGWLRKTTRRLCLAAGVPPVPPHGLRGTNATLADRAGVAALEVARSLGHAEAKTTELHYSLARDEVRRRQGLEVIRGGASG